MKTGAVCLNAKCAGMKSFALAQSKNQAGSEPNFVWELFVSGEAAVLNWDLTPVDFLLAREDRRAHRNHDQSRTGRAAAR
jgi:hypothetical protein